MGYLRYNGRKLYITRRYRSVRSMLRPYIRIHRWRLCDTCQGFYGADLDTMRDCPYCVRGYVRMPRGACTYRSPYFWRIPSLYISRRLARVYNRKYRRYVRG